MTPLRSALVGARAVCLAHSIGGAVSVLEEQASESVHPPLLPINPLHLP